MKKVFSLIWKIIAIAMIFAGIYLLIQVMGDTDSIMESYEQLTGNTMGTTNSVKVAFLREYVQRTGDRSILVTLGISGAEADIILNETDTDELAEPNDERQNAGPDDKLVNNNPELIVGEDPTINYMNPESNGFWSQGYAEWASLRGDGQNTTMKNKGCAIFAIYNAYVGHGGTVALEDIIMEYSKSKLNNVIKINAAGRPEGRLGDIGEGGGLWNYIKSNYYDCGSQNYRQDPPSQNVSDVVTSDGQYLIYYKHNGSSDYHWVYAKKSGSGFSVANSGSEGDSIDNCKVKTVYKLD